MRSLALVALCAACAGHEITVKDYPDALREAFCEQQTRCGWYPDVATCVAVTAVDPTPIAEVEAGVTRFVASAVARCLDDVAGADCAIATNRPGYAQLQADCAAVLVGLVPDGGSCMTSIDCAGGACLPGPACDAGCCPGVCFTPYPTPEGAECVIDLTCPAGDFCDQLADGSPSFCEPPISDGAACVTDDVCVEGESCLDGICEAPVNPGATCDLALATMWGECAWGTFCSTPTSTCTPYVQPGGTCGDDAWCVFVDHCDPATMTCVPKGGSGASCATIEDCIDGLECMSGKCVYLPTDEWCHH